MATILRDGQLITVPDEDFAATAEDQQSWLDLGRSGMQCTPLQGKLALGEANWQKVLDFRDGTGDWVAAGPAPWSMKTTIDSAQTWQRNSNDIAFFQYILNFTDEQVDELFRAAALINP
jgi:hypothetical protein